MASIAQGKRSDTLGEQTATSRHVLRKGKSKRNWLCINAFALAWRKLHGTFLPRAPLRLPLGYGLLPLWGVPINAPAKDLCHLPRQGRDLWKPITPNGICANP